MQRVYYVNEQNGNELNALTKARQDVRYILDEIGWNEKLIHRKIESQNKIIHYFRMGFWTVWDWTHLLNNLEEHAILLIQFPMINSLIFNEIAAKLISKEKEKKYLKVILLIHDIDSIRFPDQEMKQKKHELAFWNIADVFIAHNTEMKKYLQDLGIEKIIEKGDKVKYNVYTFGGDVKIKLGEETLNLEDAINQDKITMENILHQCILDEQAGKIEAPAEYSDGGSVIYFYPNYSILKCYRLDGNQDVYIGMPGMILTGIEGNMVTYTYGIRN